MIFSLFLDWQERLSTIALMYARIVPIFLFLPFLNAGIIGGNIVRNSIIFLLIVGLWPMIDPTPPAFALFSVEYGVLALKELIIGSAMAFVLALPFWIFGTLGALVDVSRGASMGSLVDPTNGQESTEAANLINFCVIVMFFELGGMLYILDVLAQSYQTIGFMEDFTININGLMGFMGEIMKQGFILAAPILLVLLLAECLLGLFSRFTPQLNAFSLSLTIKSVIAFFVLSMYFWQALPEKLPIFMGDYANLLLVNAGDK